MRTAYGIVGLATMLVVGMAFYLFEHRSSPKVMREDTLEEVRKTPLPITDTKSMLTLTSTAFTERGSIPMEYTCDGDNAHPELSFSGVPEGTRSLALIMDDPDIPDSVKKSMGISVFDHWVLFNMPPQTRVIQAGKVPEGAVFGNNSSGKSAYTGPCPPDREHRYFWKLFALDTVLELGEGATRAEVERVMEGHVLESATLLGTYERLAK